MDRFALHPMTEKLATPLDIGCRLTLQPLAPRGSRRHQVYLIGYVPERALVVTAPRDPEGQTHLLRDGREFAVRLLRGSRAEGFLASVLSSSLRPFPHLHLSYPQAIESIAVRDAERVDVSLPVIARNVGDPDTDDFRLPALMADISMTGARLWTSRGLGRRGDSVRIGFDVEVAGRSEPLVLIGEIRNVRAFRDTDTGEVEGIHTGLRFSHLSRHQELVLYAWILQERITSKADWAQTNLGLPVDQKAG
ncbi:MAG: flagellar brake protein [Pseudomonadota bacterium]